MGFDWTTFFFELVNFGVLLWILQRVLYRPLRGGIERRRAELAGIRERAADERREAEALRERAEVRLAEIDRVRESILADAREQASKEEARVLDQARQGAAAERERVQHTLDRERVEALAWVRDATVDNAVRVAGRLLMDLVPDQADAALRAALLDAIPAQRATFAPAARPASREETVEVELTLASAADEDWLEALRAALRDALPVPFELRSERDPSLQAGAVLRIGDHVLDASVAGRLEGLRARARELAHEVEEEEP